MAHIPSTHATGLRRSQIKKLVAKLDRRHVHQRQIEDRTIAYIEGWFAISEANAIFGFDGWDRQTLQLERIYEQNRNQETQCAYSARVRVQVKAGSQIIIREGSGFGQATARLRADAHDRALKTAETDATKRALATFGNRFGLCLYDKDQAGVTAGCTEAVISQRGLKRFCLQGPGGDILDDDLSAEAFCTGFRQMIKKVETAEDLDRLANVNAQTLQQLRQTRADLVSAKKVHFADILERLLIQRKETLVQATADPLPKEITAEKSPTEEDIPAETSAAGNDLEHTSRGAADEYGSSTQLVVPNKIDKSSLQIGTERRVRSKAHLAFVGSQPCLICSDLPSHAHHLTFAQPRGLSIKASDEFTVPLCPMHHNLLHQSANERAFWHQHGIDALQYAARLWALTAHGTVQT
jgi:DNA recombination protein Rad52